METPKKEEFTRVQRDIDGKFNYIDANGKIISDTWFDWVGDFYDDNDGFALVGRGYSEWNFIDKNGKLLSNEWFKYVYDFKDGFAVGQRTNGEYFKIDKNGKIVVCK